MIELHAVFVEGFLVTNKFLVSCFKQTVPQKLLAVYVRNVWRAVESGLVISRAGVYYETGATACLDRLICRGVQDLPCYAAAQLFRVYKHSLEAI